jgi:hypothetical protein
MRRPGHPGAPYRWAVCQRLDDARHVRKLGDQWLDKGGKPFSSSVVIMPINNAIDRNVLINHRHDGAARIAISAVVPFTLDPRLFQP